MSARSWPWAVSPLTLVNSIPDPVIATDSQMRITYISPATEEITGFKWQEARGMYCSDVLKSGLCDTRCAVKQALDTGINIFNMETFITTADNRRVPVLISAGLLQDQSDNVVGHIYIFRDISQIRKMMEDLKFSRNQLEEKNIALARALKDLQDTQNQLLKAQKMESMGILAGGIAHDFNNILSGILGYASLIKDQISDGNPLYNYVDIIEQSAVGATKLTRQLLIFSRQGNFQRKLISINKVVRDTLLIVRHTIDKAIEIKTSLSPGLPCANADESQIEQVLLNLCINATDAMEGQGMLSISTEFVTCNSECRYRLGEPNEAGYIRIKVSDTGCGIPPEIHHKIFDPFFTTKPKDRGTGLGLSTVYGIVRDHGGCIDFVSEVGKGTTFHVYIPASEDRPEPLSECPEKADTTVQQTGTILLAEDEAMIRDLVKTALDRYGYHVILARDGAEAVAIHRRRHREIDLVMLDMAMSRMGGVEAFEAIKALDPSVKVIICSGYHPDMSLFRSLERLNVDAFLNKPYTVQELVAMLRKVLTNN